MRSYLFILILALSLAMMSCSGKEESEAKKPNIIIILTDDMGFGDPGYNGNPYSLTPTLDSLSSEWFRFDNFYVCPLSAPTRASLLTGRYYLRTGTHWVTNGKENMNPEEYTLAELLKDNGYVTGAFGKWHNGAHYPFHPNQQGFDQFVGFCMGHWNNYFNTTLEENGEPVKAPGYMPDYLTGRAIDFIDQNRDKPFLCYIPYNTPHAPFQVPDQYFDKYKAMGLDDQTACVYGMNENIDDNVQRVLKKVKDAGLLENTIILFLSDNGPLPGRFNAGLRGTKGWIHEGGVKVPSLLYIPPQLLEQQSKERIISEVAAHIDIMPTLIDLLDLELKTNPDFDGLSLKKILNGQEDEKLANRLLFNKASQSQPGIWNGAVRTGEYRIILKGQDTLLYNLESDPAEQINLKDSLPDLAAELSAAYFTWIKETLDEMPAFTQIPVGYPGQNHIHMPAHEASLHGQAIYNEGYGWANEWVCHLQNPADSLSWEIKVHEKGKYRLRMLYGASIKSKGLQLSIRSANDQITQEVDKFFIGEMVPSPDRHPRIEAYEKSWGEMELGELEIGISDSRISIALTGAIIPGNDLEIKALLLDRITD